MQLIISIHALREEGDIRPPAPCCPGRYFYPRPPRGGRRGAASASAVTKNFYPRPPRGGRPGRARDPVPRERISIHALREEGDLVSCCTRRGVMSFLSTPSARRATIPATTGPTSSSYFYPRPPRGGRRGAGQSGLMLLSISIHALREEGDPRPSPPSDGTPWHFYPRPPRGGRPIRQRCRCRKDGFLSTPSARRATDAGIDYTRLSWISIHALREEGDAQGTLITDRGINFYPRPPRGGRPVGYPVISFCRTISIHALREEGDASP
mgnify:CR=1 FL=1